MNRPDVAVVGGGISGLAAAHELVGAGASVTVYEATDRVGGKIVSLPVDGLSVDGGPDAFLVRVPWARDLCLELGLGDRLVAPASGSAHLWVGDRLVPIPPSSVLGVPLDLDELAASGLVSPAGVEAVAADLTRTEPDPVTDGETIGSLVRRRLGDEVFEAIVDPLFGGVYAGSADALDLRVAAQLDAAARRGPSLVRALAESRAAGAGAAGPVFNSLRPTMGALAEALAEVHRDRIRLSTPVAAVATDPEGVAVHTSHGMARHDAVVVATPSHTAALQLGPVDVEIAEPLATVEWASVAVVVLVVERSTIAHPLEGSGFLVPAREGRMLTACSWGSNKWPHWTTPGRVVLRASVGRHGNDDAVAPSDDEIVEQVRADLGLAMGLEGPPVAARVQRWPRGLPQFGVGHLDSMTAVTERLARVAPRVGLTGAAMEGVGLPACIHHARTTAADLLARLA